MEAADGGLVGVRPRRLPLCRLSTIIWNGEWPESLPV